MRSRGPFLVGEPTAHQPTEARLRLSLGTWITLMILGIFLPMSVLTAIATWHAVQSTRELAQTRLSDLSRALATAVDNHLKAQLAALNVLALSPSLQGPPEHWDADRVDTFARAIAEQSGAAVAIFTPDGQQIVNTLMPRGASLPRTALSEMVQTVATARKPAVSDLARSTVTGRLGFGIGLPLERDGRVIAILASLSNTSILHEILAAQKLPDGIFASLVDRTATVVARSDLRHSEFAGRKIAPENARRLSSGDAGRYHGRALEGILREFAFTKLSLAAGWALVVGQSAEDLNADAENYARYIALIGILVLAISISLALGITRLIVTPIAALDRYAVEIGHESVSAKVPANLPAITQVARLQGNLLEAERRLKINERRFHELLALLDLGIFMARSIDGQILYWSHGAEEVYGWRPQDAVGQNAHVLLKTVFPIDIQEVNGQLRTHGRWSGVLTHRTRDGREVHMVAQMSMTEHASEPGQVLEILHDVTEQHRAERELRLALDTGQIGTFFIDLVAHTVTLDTRSRALMMSDADVVSRDEFIALIPPGERGPFNAALARCIGPRGDGLLDVEIDISAASVSVRGQAERNGDLPMSVAGVMMDVTRLRGSGVRRSQSDNVRSTG